MFGYIHPFREELKVCENELYKAVYCGLCRAMGRRICRSFTLTLSYDAVFLVLVRLAATGEKGSVKQGRCAAHPLKKRNYITAEDTMSYCARAYAVLAECKAGDDVADSKGFAKIPARVKRAGARRFGKKAALHDLAPLLTGHLEKIAGYEKDGVASPDPPADEFGRLLAEVFCYGTEGSIRRILYDIGYHTGRWIYIIDACDDFESDMKKGSFNPFSQCGSLPAQQIENALNLELELLSHTIDLLPQCDRSIRDIIENTVYLGMPQTAKKILAKRTDKQTKGTDSDDRPLQGTGR